MSERTLKQISSPDGNWLAVVVQRTDGTYTYRVMHGDLTGPDVGIYDTAEKAEIEASSKMRQKMS